MKTRHGSLLFFLALGGTAWAQSPQLILEALTREAGGSVSIERGERFYHARPGGGEAESCATCHTADARQPGVHFRTRKRIEPLAPAANRERFTDRAKVEKWFARNCRDVLGRACTAQEKADFAAYVISLK